MHMIGEEDRMPGAIAASFREISEQEILPTAQAVIVAALEGAGYELIRREQLHSGQSLLLMVPELGRRFEDLIDRAAQADT